METDAIAVVTVSIVFSLLLFESSGSATLEYIDDDDGGRGS